jgi:hypothetical protein
MGECQRGDVGLLEYSPICIRPHMGEYKIKENH